MIIIGSSHKNFGVERIDNRSILVKDSVLNTSLGPIQIESKSFDNIQNNDYLILKITTLRETISMISPVSGVDGAGYCKFNTIKEINRSAEFLIGRLEDKTSNSGTIYNYDDMIPIEDLYYDNYFINNMVIGIIKIKDDDIKVKKIRDHKINIPFYGYLYFGLGQID